MKKFGKNAAKIARCQANHDRKKARKASQLKQRRAKAKAKVAEKRRKGVKMVHTKPNTVLVGGLNNPYPLI